MSKGINEKINEDQELAFWSKVDIKDDVKKCWFWLGAKKTKGYGNLTINKNHKLAHRVAFELINGEIPNGFIVCHICDEPSCCNPSHLMLGTTKSNAVDMLIKNRQKKKIYAARGERNGSSKLDVEKVKTIRRCGKGAVHLLAKMYGVRTNTIRSALNNKTWRHVT